MNPMSVFAILG